MNGGDWMEYIEYKKTKHELSKLILQFQSDYNVKEEWLLRMLIEEAQCNVVRFMDDD